MYIMVLEFALNTNQSILFFSIYLRLGYPLFTVPLQIKIMHRKLWIWIGTITLLC